jgi:hypothetical protein
MSSPEKSFLARVRAALPAMHPAERRLGEFVCDFPGELASYSGSELAALAHVSKATVSRFVQRLGYDSYESARRHAREEKQTGSRLFLASAARAGAVQTVQAHIAQGIANLEATFLSITDAQIDAATQALLDARKVWVLGFRASQPFASYLQWQLTQVIEQIVAIPGAGQTLGEHLASFTPQDVGGGVRPAPAHRAHAAGAGRGPEERRAAALHHGRRCAVPAGGELALPAASRWHRAPCSTTWPWQPCATCWPRGPSRRLAPPGASACAASRRSTTTSKSCSGRRPACRRIREGLAPTVRRSRRRAAPRLLSRGFRASVPCPQDTAEHHRRPRPSASPPRDQSRPAGAGTRTRPPGHSLPGALRTTPARHRHQPRARLRHPESSQEAPIAPFRWRNYSFFNCGKKLAFLTTAGTTPPSNRLLQGTCHVPAHLLPRPRHLPRSRCPRPASQPQGPGAARRLGPHPEEQGTTLLREAGRHHRHRRQRAVRASGRGRHPRHGRAARAQVRPLRHRLHPRPAGQPGRAHHPGPGPPWA